MSELGMVFDTLTKTAQEMGEVADTMDTIKNICDGVVMALQAASVIPGAAAFTGPVIAVYRSIEPTLDIVIDLMKMVDDYCLKAIGVMQSLDDMLSGEWNNFAGQPLMPISPV